MTDHVPDDHDLLDEEPDAYDRGDSRAATRRFLDTHNFFWEEMGKENDAPEGRSRLGTLTYASVGAINSAVALAWVAREFGRDRADELALLMANYADNGEDYDALFEDMPEWRDTSITLVVPAAAGPDKA